MHRYLKGYLFVIASAVILGWRTAAGSILVILATVLIAAFDRKQSQTRKSAVDFFRGTFLILQKHFRINLQTSPLYHMAINQNNGGNKL